MDHKLKQLATVYEELDKRDAFIEVYFETIIGDAKERFISDPDAIYGIEFEDYALPVFIPKSQQVFLQEMKRMELICNVTQVSLVQAEFIRRYMETIFVQRIMKLFLQPLLQEEDFAEYVAKVVISVGIVFESLKPTLNDCQQQVND